MALKGHSLGRSWQQSTGQSMICWILQDPLSEGYHCPPAVTDATTHFGAMSDIESGDSARVPVALGAYLPKKATKVSCVCQLLLCLLSDCACCMTPAQQLPRFHQ